MKATGIVRRIDDLGRVVIPREVRKTMGIREGDALEIFTDKDTVIFKPYLPYQEPWRMLENVAEELANNEDFRKYRGAVMELAKRMKKESETI